MVHGTVYTTWYSTTAVCTIWYSTIAVYTIWYSTIAVYTIWYSTIAVYTIWYSTIVVYIIWYTGQAFMQRPVHPSFGRVKLVMDGQKFEKTGITHLIMVTSVLLRLYDGL